MANMLRKLFLFVILFSVFSLNAQRLQAVHTMADPSMDPADVYITVSIITIELLGIEFRNVAGPMTDVPFPNLPINVDVAPGGGSVVANFTVMLSPNETYIGVVRGVQTPASFAPNPEGKDISLDFTLKDGIREVSNVAGQVEYIFANTVTDAPALKLIRRGGGAVANNISYGEISGYTSAPASMHTFDVKSADESMHYGAFDMDFSTFADSTFILVASGFLDPSQNQNGPKLSLDAFTPGGARITSTENPTGINDGTSGLISEFRLEQNYPNPFNPVTQIDFTLPSRQDVTLSVYNAAGQEISALLKAPLAAGKHNVQWDAAAFPSGIYFYRLDAGIFSQTRKMILMK